MNALSHHFARDHRKALTWTIGLPMAVLLAAGGALAGSQLAGGSAGGSDGGSAGPGATLNAALSAAGSSATTHHPGLGAIARLRRLGGMYGQFSVRTRNGATRTVMFERGVITSARPDLVVKAANGTTWTWQFTPGTIVRQGGAKGSRTGLSPGQHVLVAGPLAGGARDARLIVVRGTKAAGATPSASPSAAGSAATNLSLNPEVNGSRRLLQPPGIAI
jgi:hypothetical protein